MIEAATERAATLTLQVQTGDVAEAVDRFAAGGAETFRDQRRSVSNLQARALSHPTTVLCQTDRPYDRELSPGLRVIGWAPADLHARAMGRRIVDMVGPTRLIARLPHIGLLEAAVADGLPTFACLADIMLWPKIPDFLGRSGPRRLLTNIRLRRVLADANVVAVANHGRRAALSLGQVLKVPRRKTLIQSLVPIPMDEASDRPRTGLLYVGALEQAKGVGDLVAAIGRSGDAAPPLAIVGAGAMRPELERMVDEGGLAGKVTFEGRLGNDAVLDLMRSAEAVVVPSRRSYAEGMPNVISEALSTRTPLIISDHPAFQGRLTDGKSTLVFRGGDPDSLGDAIRRLRSDPSLRRALSDNAEDTIRSLHVGHPTDALFDRFVADDRNRTGWVDALGLEGEAAGWL